MVRLPMPSRVRQTALSMLSHPSGRLLRALPRQPHPRAHFSSASQLCSYQSLRATTPQESSHTPPPSSPLGAASTVKHATPFTQPLHRHRQIADTISQTTKSAMAAAINDSSIERRPQYGDFLLHFGGGAQKPEVYLPDGTDRFHWPGEPWNRRVWAGGSITWGSKWADTFWLPREVGAEIARDGERNEESYLVARRLKCVERIQSSEHKGVPGSGREKVLVQTRRTYLPEHRDEDNPAAEPFAVTERRDLVFMRSPTSEEAKQALSLPDRVIKPIATPDHHMLMTPRQPLLAEFSCLTHNAHRIHLDRGYAASEGFRNLVVHGPLSLYLMLTFLERVLPAEAQLVRFDYRNLAPLFCDEGMKICVSKTSDTSPPANDTPPHAPSPTTPPPPTPPPPPTHQTYTVSILSSHGGYAVKGTATVLIHPPSPASKNSDPPRSGPRAECED